jgi:hypothetical protein
MLSYHSSDFANLPGTFLVWRTVELVHTPLADHPHMRARRISGEPLTAGVKPRPSPEIGAHPTSISWNE